MTREEAKKRAELYSALVEGKTIQCINTKSGTWEDVKIEEFLRIHDSNNYRIKPEPKYRPFKTQEECWQEMSKHQSFGWVKNGCGNIFNIIAIFKESIKLNECCTFYSDLCKQFKFPDDTPFGIKED